MSDIKMPTPGRIVQYWPNGKDLTAQANIDHFIGHLPAMVVSQNGLSLTLNVFTAIKSNPIQVRVNVPHQSEIKNGEAYWLWPSY